MFKAGWLRKVHAEQFHCSPSPSESPDPDVGGWTGGAGGMAWILGGNGGGAVNEKKVLDIRSGLFFFPSYQCSIMFYL